MNLKPAHLVIVAATAIWAVIMATSSVLPDGAGSHRIMRDVCCEQCRYGAGHDVRGMSPESFPCTDYRGLNRFDAVSGVAIDESVLSPACVKYFEGNGMAVSDCRE